MSITPLRFTGVSTFSDDFQLVVERAVEIASLPLIELQNDQADLLAKKNLLSGLRTKVASLAAEVGELAALGETGALNASSSNSNRVSVTLNGATETGKYTISDIISVASAASEVTASGYADSDTTAVSGDGTMELAFGAETYEIDLTGEYGNNLEGLRDAINALGAGVSATILNTGTGGTPYYLSVTAQDTGATALELRETAGESGTNILTADNQGSDAVFKLNGLDITRSQNTVNDVIDGLSFTIVNETDVDETVELTLSASKTSLGSALSGMVTAYNAARDEALLQVGESAGLLSGNHVVIEIQNQMRSLASYTSDTGGAITSLTDLGIEFDQLGVMSFDTSKFYSLTQAEFADALDFLGNSTAGLGLVQAGLEEISDPVTGLIATQQAQYDTADIRIEKQILTMSERLEYMQRSVSTNLQMADALISQLESQQTILQGSIDAFYLTLYGRNDE